MYLFHFKVIINNYLQLHRKPISFSKPHNYGEMCQFGIRFTGLSCHLSHKVQAASIDQLKHAFGNRISNLQVEGSGVLMGDICSCSA